MLLNQIKMKAVNQKEINLHKEIKMMEANAVLTQKLAENEKIRFQFKEK